MEDRKLSELSAYQSQYSAGRENSNTEIRELLLGQSEKAFSDMLVKFISEGKKKALEIGCGSAFHSVLAAKAGAYVIATDISGEALNVAKKTATAAGLSAGVEYIEMDCESMPLADSSVDLVINHEVFSSVDIHKALPEIARVLVAGGKVVSMETYGHNPLLNLNRWIKVILGKRTKWAASHIWTADSFEIAAIYFSDIKVQYFHLLSPFAMPLKFFMPRKVCKFLLNAIDGIDGFLLKSPFFQRYAFKVVFEMSRK